MGRCTFLPPGGLNTTREGTKVHTTPAEGNGIESFEWDPGFKWDPSNLSDYDAEFLKSCGVRSATPEEIAAEKRSAQAGLRRAEKFASAMEALYVEVSSRPRQREIATGLHRRHDVRHRRASSARPVRSRGSRRVTGTSASRGDPSDLGDEPPSQSPSLIGGGQ
jgi:hypothetical protein